MSILDMDFSSSQMARTVLMLPAICIMSWSISAPEGRGAGPPQPHSPHVDVLALFTSDAKTVVVGSRQLVLFDARSPFRNRTELSFIDLPQAFSITPDGSKLIVAGRRGVIEVFHLKPVPKSSFRLSLSRSLLSIAISPDGRYVAAGGIGTGGDTVVVFWANTEPPLKPGFGIVVNPNESARPGVRLSGHFRLVQALAFTHDGQKLVTGDGNGTLRCWLVSTGKLLWQAKPHRGGTVETITCLSTKVISTGEDGNLCITFLENGKTEKRIKAHRKMVLCSAVSANHKMVATYGADFKLALWDIEKMKCVAATSLRPPVRETPALHVLPSGNVMYHDGTTLRVFQPKEGKLVEQSP